MYRAKAKDRDQLDGTPTEATGVGCDHLSCVSGRRGLSDLLSSRAGDGGPDDQDSRTTVTGDLLGCHSASIRDGGIAIMVLIPAAIIIGIIGVIVELGQRQAVSQ